MSKIKSLSMQEAYNIAKELSTQPGHTPHKGYLPLLLDNIQRAKDTELDAYNETRSKDYKIPKDKYTDYYTATMYINNKGTLIPIDEPVVFNIWTLHYSFKAIEAPLSQTWYIIMEMYRCYQDPIKRIKDACALLLKNKEEVEDDAIIKLYATKGGDYRACITTKHYEEEKAAKDAAKYNRLATGTMTDEEAAEYQDMQRARMASETLEQDKRTRLPHKAPEASPEAKAEFARRCAEAQKAQKAMQDKLHKISK